MPRAEPAAIPPDPPRAEPAIDADRPIVDPHLHLWDIRPDAGGLQAPQRFLLPEAASTIAAGGHRVTHAVFVECRAMYRQDGPPDERSVGETEFAAGMAAMADSGGYGACRIAHRIVANADLTLGEAVAPVLELHRARAGGRLRGVRTNTSHSEGGLFGHPAEAAARTRLADPRFVAGAGVLARMGLVLDVWCLHPQLPGLAALADALPGLTIVLDHAGTPDLHGRTAAEAAAQWEGAMRDLARRANVRVKLSGFGMDLSAPIAAATGPHGSAALAARWRPWIATAIDAFSPGRCMFASNYPPDRAAAAYGTIWNAFKRIAADYPEAERDAMFRRTAADTYAIAPAD